MRRLSKVTAAVITLLTGIFIFVGPIKAIQPDTSALSLGDMLPNISGQTLKGSLLHLPVSGDKAAVLVFSFSRAAGNDARVWNKHLSKDFPGALPVYGIVLLESAPKLFRGMAVAGMKSSIPVSAQSQTMVLYKDEKVWEQRLAVGDESRAYVLLLGSDGRLHWRNSGTFSNVEYAQFENELSRLMAK